MPSRTIEDQGHLHSSVDGPTDLFEVELHDVAVAMCHDEADSRAARRIDGTEDIGGLGAILIDKDWSGAPLCPQPRRLRLLPEAAFVLVPDLKLALWMLGLNDAEKLRQRLAAPASESARILPLMTRSWSKSNETKSSE